MTTPSSISTPSHPTIYTPSLHDALPIWIAKINRDRHAVAHGELHRVQVVTEKLVQSQYALFHSLQDLLRSMPLGLVDRKSTRLNSSHRCTSYAVFCLKKKNNNVLLL